MRRSATVLLALALVATGASPASGRAARRRLDRLVAGRSLGVSVWRHGARIYEHEPKLRRVPASNQKLLTSMALLDVLGPARRLPTIAAARRVRGGVVTGNLWILGRGDPALGSRRSFVRELRFGATRVQALARRIAGAGIRRVRGRVIGSTGYFRHDWRAPGWRPYFRARYVAVPTALTFEGNSHGGRYIRDPERRLAGVLTSHLRSLGVKVGGRPAAGRPPRRLAPLARVWSRPLQALLGYMNRRSSNFFAEVLGKRLSVARWGRPGSIAGAARAVTEWAAARDVKVVAHDASGLSYRNGISARGLVRLLQAANRSPWGRVLRRSLPGPGQGTLEGRLRGLHVRAKTGTLDRVSALSGWVWLRRSRTWAEFAIMSRGIPKHRAVDVEDRIVKILSLRGRPGAAATETRAGR
jgi:D-alanyl-D-alanine carboxypeptidase